MTSPVQNTPVQNTPVQNTPVQNTPVQDVPVQDVPVQNVPVQNTQSTHHSAALPVQRNEARGSQARGRRLSETKSAFKTTEFLVYLVAVAGVLLTSDLVGRSTSGRDFLNADRSWLYIAILTVGYMISRGLAKSGSRDHYDS